MVLFVLSKLLSGRQCMLEKEGGNSVPYSPLVGSLPGSSYISANVAGQCGQAERGSEILLLNHPQFLVAGLLRAMRWSW